MTAQSTPQTTCLLIYSLRPKVFKPLAILSLLTAWLALPVFANPQVEALLASDPAPEGVVIEIVESDEEALAELLPRVRNTIVQLRANFPDVEVAVVSHGSEQFALQSQYREEYPNIHADAQSLMNDDVQIHVCGVHASWYGVTPEDFPDYVDVSPSGPAQIRQYEALDYKWLRIQTDD